MFSIVACQLPEGALLQRHRADGAFTDCFASIIPRAVTIGEYVAAFYTTPVFRLERLILEWALSRPSTDAEAQQLAGGSIDTFSAWSVESRRDDQLLMADMQGRTRSWLMVAPLRQSGSPATRLYFGSAVIPVLDRQTGERVLSPGFRALLGFHRVYSEVLLYSARVRLGAPLS